jgi:hypothetical protein
MILVKKLRMHLTNSTVVIVSSHVGDKDAWMQGIVSRNTLRSAGAAVLLGGALLAIAAVGGIAYRHCILSSLGSAQQALGQY